MVSSRSVVEPRKIRYGSPIEVIFGKHYQEVAPPEFRPRVAEHAASH